MIAHSLNDGFTVPSNYDQLKFPIRLKQANQLHFCHLRTMVFAKMTDLQLKCYPNSYLDC